MHVAIPSKGRAGAVKSRKVLPSATLYVPEAEILDYALAYDAPVIGVPDAVRGITATRNWILDHALETGERRVVFVDDDVRLAGWCELLPFRVTHHKLSEGEWLAEWAKLFDLIEGLGLRLWGVATHSSAQAIYPWAPFRFHSYVTASCMGMVNDPALRFDETFPVKEDYELCLRCIKEDGAILSAQYLYWENEHWSTAGGCKDYRTQAMEREAIERLMARYPGLIRRVRRKGTDYAIELEF